MNSKKEKFIIALIVLGAAVMAIGAVVVQFVQMPIISIVGYIAGGVLIAAGVVWYFVDYYKVKKYDIPEASSSIENSFNEHAASNNTSYDSFVNMNEVNKTYNGEPAQSTQPYSTMSSTNVSTTTTSTTTHTGGFGDNPLGDISGQVDSAFNQLGFDNFDDYKKLSKGNMKMTTPMQIVEMVLFLLLIISGIASLFLGATIMSESEFSSVLIIYGFAAFGGGVIFEILKSIIQRRIIFSSLKNVEKYAADSNLVEGVVLQTGMHSSVTSNAKKNNSKNVVYKIQVKINNYNAEINGPKDTVIMYCLKKYPAGTPVKFYQNKVKFKKCYLIEK